MTLDAMIEQAKKQQDLTGNPKAAVSFFIPGKWPNNGDKKRLFGRSGPLGRCIAEYENDVLVVFEADVVIAACEKAKGA